MARDFEDIHDIGDLTDGELRDVVRERLSAHNGLDIAELTVTVQQGHVILAGRVGTDGERQMAEQVVADGLGISDYQNDIFVDPMRRALSPEDMDEHLEEDDRTEGLVLGDRPVGLSPEAEHLADDPDEYLFGTSDVHKATRDAAPWIPPEGPVPEGPTPGGEFGEDH
jgi:hypothetical protein